MRLKLLICVVILVMTSLVGVSARVRAFEIPATPAGDQLAWTLDQVNNGGQDLGNESLGSRFTSEFLQALPADELRWVLQSYVGSVAPVEVLRFEGGVTNNRANALLRTNAGAWRVTLEVDTSDNRINGLFFEPAYVPLGLDDPPDNWSDLKRQIEALAPQTSFIAAELVDGECVPFARVHPEQSLAIASTFKVYLLGELARQVSAGEATWDELIPLDPGLISMPNGDMRYLPLGSQYSLTYFAEQMMSISDNTATDHLINRLGRENVEAAFGWMGQEHPERNSPLLMTREWFAMKMRFSDEDLQRYAEADDATQRKFLAEEAAPIADTLQEWEPWYAFRAFDSVEWFASAGDLCRAMASLHEIGSEPGMEPVLNSLSIEPGIILDPADWRYVGYKGGYETGVLSYTWLLQRDDGRWFVLASIANNTQADNNGYLTSMLMIAAADMLAEEE